jgi:hypothetical protein
MLLLLSHLQRCADEEVLLLEAQLLALRRGVVGVQHCADGCSTLTLLNSLTAAAADISVLRMHMSIYR